MTPGAARAGAIAEMVADEAAKFILDGAMGHAGRGHRLRLAVDQLPELGGRWVPSEKLRDGHADWDFGQGAHASI